MRRLALLLLLTLSACSENASPLVPQLRPVSGGFLSDTFGARSVHPIKGATPGGHHDGCDFAVAQGSSIKAARAGVVSYVGWLGGYGRTVIVKHENGLTTLYGHAQALAVKKGQKVAAGQVLARVGSTGLSTGPHLHYELRKNGVPIAPGPFQEPPIHLAAVDAAPNTRFKVTSLGNHMTKRDRRPAPSRRKAPWASRI